MFKALTEPHDVAAYRGKRRNAKRSSCIRDANYERRLPEFFSSLVAPLMCQETLHRPHCDRYDSITGRLRRGKHLPSLHVHLAWQRAKLLLVADAL